MNVTRILGGLQIVALAAQGTPDLLGLVAPRYHPLFHFAVSVIQALGWWAQRGYDQAGTRTPGGVV